MCDWQGKTIITYACGNQLGFVYTCEAEYDGTVDDFLAANFMSSVRPAAPASRKLDPDARRDSRRGTEDCVENVKRQACSAGGGRIHCRRVTRP